MIRVSLATLSLCLAASLASAQTGSRLDYDTFCKLNSAEKNQAFATASPETKAELARTQFERWRDANKGQLSAAQLSVLQDVIAFITPAMYVNDGSSSQDTGAAELHERHQSLFTAEQRRQMTPVAPCIPKRQPPNRYAAFFSASLNSATRAETSNNRLTTPAAIAGDALSVE